MSDASSPTFSHLLLHHRSIFKVPLLPALTIFVHQSDLVKSGLLHQSLQCGVIFAPPKVVRPPSNKYCRRPPLQIVLMRHGKPRIEKQPRLNAIEFGAWVEKYNAAGIDTEYQPPRVAVEQASQCRFAVCSNLSRSVESARALGIERVGISDLIFREMEMPHAAWRFPKFPVLVWSVIFRLAWVLGYSAGGESFKAAKERAGSCAQQLACLAAAHGTVLFVGHGLLNRFIAKHLKSMGWLCAEKSPRKYWEFSVLHIQAT